MIEWLIANKLGVIRAFAIGLALSAVILGMIQYGRKDEQTKQATVIVEKGKEANEIRNKNRATLNDGDAIKRLRQSWSR